MTYLISKFLSPEIVEQTKRQLIDAEWEDGLDSFALHERDADKDAHLVKKNFQTDINSTELFKGVDSNMEFLNFTCPISSTEPLFTKTETGGYYRSHWDDVNNGQFSTTIFLSDPRDYEGGELTLYLNGQEEKFKLEPGWGITYETGTPHEVKTVTSGERLVSVFWTTSMIWDIEALREYRYWNMMVRRHDPKFVYDNVTDFANCLHNHFSMKADRIWRLFHHKHQDIPPHHH